MTHVVQSPVRLVPVVEFEPATYATQTHTFGDGATAADPQGADRYWRVSLADSGLQGLEPFPPRSWLVPIDQLKAPHTLTTLLHAHADALQDEEDPHATHDWRESLSAFDGGFVLCEGELPLVSPGCCCDLSNLDDWRSALSAAGDWKDLWIGHPLASSWRDGEALLIRQNSEHGPPDEPSLLRVPVSALEPAIDGARTALEAFAVQLEPVAAEWLTRVGLDPIEGMELARLLAGLDNGVQGRRT